MARTKIVTVNETEYTLQSVTFSWYSNLTDLYINPANGRKNTAKYVDALIKGCVTAPAEVGEIETFLAERNKPKDSKAQG